MTISTEQFIENIISIIDKRDEDAEHTDSTVDHSGDNGSRV